MRPFFAALFMAGAMTTGSLAQVRPEFSIDFVLGLPQGEFDEHLTNPGFGVSMFGGVGLGQSPVVLGVTGSILVYGIERRHVPFSLTIPDVTVEVETQNNIATGHLVLRLQPPRSRIKPYLDGLFGFNYLFTESSVKDTGFSDDDVVSSKNFDDAALSYGVGAGLTVHLHQSPEVGVRLSVGMRYLIGGSAEYLTKGAISREGGRVSLETERSATDLLVPHLGVAFDF